MYKKAGNHYLDFTRKERRGIFFLLSLIIIITSIPFFYPLIVKEKIVDKNFDNEMEALKSLAIDSNRFAAKEYDEDDYREKNYVRKKEYYKVRGTEFEFDPNTISATDWSKLGVNERTISTIQHYLSKGGRFRKPEDLKNIWGIHEDDLKRLLPFVRIREKAFAGFNGEKNFNIRKDPVVIDINSSDSSAFIELPGIGSRLSKRIIGFREKLGGFYSVDQVAETFGLPDSVFRKIRPSLIISGEIKKININTATLDEMKSHPYIRYNLANAIVQFRAQNGGYKSVADIKKIMIVDEVVYKKLSPYLVTE